MSLSKAFNELNIDKCNDGDNYHTIIRPGCVGIWMYKWGFNMPYIDMLQSFESSGDNS